ncbi:phosphonate metabolism transcriptional regulator PhnF [Rhodovulum tesquicola]|uniref:phosphonate metabolism transcriptional regulator PhnF n=1 Tax=Rhodovulum tesquicola TaxID=540254 RepID=UPI002097EF51|nr:phosphonate metabolism transcriptional regulator PhnF [Rhodovulum tesquicola]MCO8146084.1 phosphonate metabolism transcriptional regulator PhnF [Rhodovulum tesquicola]
MTADTPLWRQIAETLTAELANASPGDRLPSEARLAARFGVNRHTVRRALAALAEAGLVHARRGAGVQVTALPTDYPIGRRTRFHAALEATGRVPGRRVLSVETQPGLAEECAMLALPGGSPLVRAEGLTLSDGQVIGHFRSVFPVLPGLAAELARGEGVTRALAACGVSDYTRAWTRLTAVPADALLAGHLQLRRGEPVMRAVALNHDPRGQPLEYGITHFAGARVTLTVAPD